MAFLSHAGYRMHRVYGSQFLKVLQYISDNFLPALEQKKDADVGAVLTRLSTYIRQQQYKQEPEGMELPKVDDSSFYRA
jgi:nucleoporin GLE1